MLTAAIFAIFAAHFLVAATSGRQHGSALEQYSLWSTPSWAVQPNGTICGPMKLHDFLRLEALFREVASLFSALSVRWMLSHGSLLGSWLHHGPIPWDEEGDVILLPEDWARLSGQLAPSSTTELREYATGGGSSMRVYEGPRVGGLQYDWHEHVDKTGVWLATVISFRLAADSRNSPVHVDAFLARTNGTHAWTDSAILPLSALVPARRLRFYDWLAPAPRDPLAVLEIWYGPRFMAQRKCALRRAGDKSDSAEISPASPIGQVAGGAVAKHYPLIRNEWTTSSEVLKCTMHKNGSILWTLTIDTVSGKLVRADGRKNDFNLQAAALEFPGPPARLRRIGEGPIGINPSNAISAAEHVKSGRFPNDVPNAWD